MNKQHTIKSLKKQLRSAIKEVANTARLYGENKAGLDYLVYKINEFNLILDDEHYSDEIPLLISTFRRDFAEVLKK